MTNKEGQKVADMTRALSVILAMDSDENNPRVDLTQRERNWVDNARIQGLELLRSRVQNAEAAIAQADAWVSTAEQTEFDFSPDTRTKDPGHDGSLPERVPGFEEPELDFEGAEGEQRQPGKIDWRIPGSNGVPADVQRGIVQALRDGCGKTKACEVVAELTGQDVFGVKAHFETLVHLGVVTKNGRGWVADWPEDRPEVDTHAGPDGVVATSETPEAANF